MLNRTRIDELTAAILKDNPEVSVETADRLARKLHAETDERLEENVRQWLENRPLTAIVLGDYSVPLIMQIRGNRDFFGALGAMNAYLADPEAGARKIWRQRR